MEIYRRDDELWDIEANVVDVKHKDFPLETLVRKAGEHFHDMLLTLTIDERMSVVAVQAQTRAAPYEQDCKNFSEVYQKLVGLNLLQSFRAAVRERVGDNKGCTHINELAAILPTAAIQAFAGEMKRPDRADGSMPKHIDRCHALRRDGPVVARRYPSWYIHSQTGEEKNENP